MSQIDAGAADTQVDIYATNFATAFTDNGSRTRVPSRVGVQAAATTLHTVNGRIPVYNSANPPTIVGYIPLYNSIT